MMKKKTKLIIFASSIFLLGSAGVVTYQLNQPDSPTQSLTQKQQESLLKAELTATENNSKPKDIIGAFQDKNRFSKLSKDNKEAASIIMYNSIQNASLYYNNLNTILAGEIDYSRGESFNPLDAQKDNQIISGLVKEVNSQYLSIKPINKSQFLVLPDWNKIQNLTQIKETDSEMSYLVKAGLEADELKIFEGDRIQVYNAAKAFDRVDKQLKLLKEKNPDSVWIQDLNSLLRIYNDITFGYVETNNLSRTNTDGVVSLDSKTISELNKVANSNLSLSTDAKEYLKNVKDNKIKSSILQTGAEKSTETFGTSTFWQGQTDISSLLKANQQ